MKEEKGILTVAVGKKYAVQAKYLALSAMLNSPHTPRAVVTDYPEMVKRYYDFVIPYNPEYGDPFMTKTRLHLYTPFEQTLFIDADSLVMHNIDSYWDALNHRSFAYRGILRTTGEWYLDIEKMIKETGVEWIPQLNTGMFVFDKSDKTKGIFDTAFDYMKDNRLNFGFFRDTMLSDEPFLAIGLAKCGEKPYEDHGRFSRAFMNATDIHIDVIKRVSYFRTVYGYYVYPLVLHFCGRFAQYFYFFEKIKLYYHFNHPLQVVFSNLFVLSRNIFKKRKKPAI